MQTMTIDQIRGVPHRTPISAFQAVVEKAYERKEGTNKAGKPWAIQNVILRTGTDSIKCLLTGREAFPFYEGQTVALKCKDSDRGPSGLYAEDDTYSGETRRILKVTPTAQISLLDGARPPNTGSQQEQPPPQSEPPPHFVDPGPEAPDQQWTTDREDLHRAKRTIVQITNLHTLCALAVERMEAETLETVTGHLMGEQQRQSAAASVFIKAERSGLVDKMPTKPFQPGDLK